VRFLRVKRKGRISIFFSEFPLDLLEIYSAYLSPPFQKHRG